MHSLVIASTSLANFQRLAFSDTQPIATHETISRTEFHAHDNPTSSANQSPSTPRNQAANALGEKRLYTGNTSPFSSISQTPSFRSRSPECEEECCGGIVDCDAMESDHIIQQEEERTGGTELRTSELRSTADHRLQTDSIPSHQSI